jgi:hypothetical protein
MTNEFEQIEEDFPDAKSNEVPGESGDMISGSNAGTVYDWNTAPDTIKAPPRVNLNGKEVIIEKAEIILPALSVAWNTIGRNKKAVKPNKSCVFKLHYNTEGQQEFFSGVRVFQTIDEKTKAEKYSHPTIFRTVEGTNKMNQATELLFKYAEYKKIKPEMVSMKEFMAYLNSKPKAKIISKEYENPDTGKKVSKNMIDCFL